MDRVDRQIVHCLQRDGRASFRRIADVVGVSEQTIARRYRALYAEGTLRVLVLRDARASGEQTWFARIRCRPDATNTLAEALAARDDVSWVSVTAGGAEIICVTRSDPRTSPGSVLLERLPRSSRVLGFAAHQVLRVHVGGAAEWTAFDDPLTAEQIIRLGPHQGGGNGTRAPRVHLDDDDHPLLDALTRDGRASVAALARATGWAPARVATRIEQLFTSGALQVELDVALGRFGFHAMAYVWLTVAPGDLEATGHALSRHPETSFTAAITGTSNLMVAVNCHDTDALYNYVTTKIGALPAVGQAETVPVLRRVKQAGTRIQDDRLIITPAPRHRG